MPCAPGANPFIERVFGDCVYNARDLTGFSLGIASIACWMVAQLPQLVKNYKTKSAEALSAWFLAEWLLGDTCNLVGALLKGDQLPTVVFTAEYFICMDAVLLLQYIYYYTLQRRRELLAARRHRHHRHHHRHRHHHAQHGSSVGGAAEHAHAGGGGGSSSGAARGDMPEVVTHTEAAPSLVAAGTSAGNGREFVFRPQRALACVGLLFLLSGVWQPWQPPPWAAEQQRQQQQQQLAGTHHPGQPWGQGWRRLLVVGSAAGAEAVDSMPTWSRQAGTVIAYCSSVLYLTSRVSQITKNHRRRSAEGLALTMFLCAIAANTLYGLSIVMRSYSLDSLRSSLPWLLGSLGTVVLDMTIFAQGLIYGTGPKHASDEEEALLLEGGKV